MRNRRFTLTIGAMLLLPGLATLASRWLPADEVDLTEARRLAPAPAWSSLRPGCWSQFAQATDAFLDDHFALRPPLLQANASLRSITRTPASDTVVLGHDGWLFLANDLKEEKSMAAVVAHARMLEAMARHQERQGAHFAVLVAPDKQTIYPEMLPGWARPHATTATFDRMVAELRQRGVAVADVRDALRAAKAQGPQYFRTDTHWTRLGARTAFNATLAELGLRPVGTSWELGWQDVASEGHDLNRAAWMGAASRDFHVDDFPLEGVQLDEIPMRNGGGYRARRPGSGWTTVILGDSFTRHSAPALALEVGPELVWISHGRCSFDPGTVEAAQGALVVYEIVERNLGCPVEDAERVIEAYSGGRVPPPEPFEPEPEGSDVVACVPGGTPD